MNNRGIFIAVEGPIGVGKTTLANILNQHFGYTLLREIVEENPFLSKFYTDIKEYALNQAILGKNYPNLKLVEGRSNRKYLNEDEVATAVINAGYDPYEKKLLGITAMTNLLGRTKFNEVLGNLIYKPQGKPTLVLESDKRPAMPINDFKDEREEINHE